MQQENLERFAFLYLCGEKDRDILLGRREMTFIDFDRLTYLADFFGLSRFNMEVWNQHIEMFTPQLGKLMRFTKERDFEPDLEVMESDMALHDMWIMDFCRNVPDEEYRGYLSKYIKNILDKQGIELPEFEILEKNLYKEVAG